MNYMHLIKITSLDKDTVKSRVCFYKREEFFRNHFNKIKVVPSFLLLEAIFQTAGRLSRFVHGNKMGGTIVSFRHFSLSRPIFANEELMITACLISSNAGSSYFSVDVFSSEPSLEEHLLKSGKLLISLNEGIATKKLNNDMGNELEEHINKMRWKT
jgi:3-hydroxymyristoyl/3-hydroxydecanoyl-(acyl carrier protein) dehydratase